jgi:crotonobetainyl-CoA:carnitine CoA-transferase CaiB-like acyl-CoA transferase
MSDLLEGIRVVEAAIYGFVPSAAAALADWGADVVKVEHPVHGDPIRGLVSYGVKPGDGGVTPLWEVFNRGKRSVGIDLATEQGLQLLMELIDEADVFLTNFMRPARAKLGIDVDHVLARNPRIIYGRGTGHGPIGPDADKGGFDGVTYWSRSGASAAASPPDYGFPVMLPGPAFGDVQTGMNLAGGVVSALYRREKTGKGGVVDVSLLNSGLWATIATAHAGGTANISQLDRRNPPNPLTNLFRTGDGRFFVLGLLESDPHWPGLCQVLGRPELETDPRFDSHAARGRNAAECVKVFDEIFAALTLAEVTEKLNAQTGPWSLVSMPGDTLADEQAVVNGYLQVLDYDNGATLPLVTAPVQFDGSEAPRLTRAPGHGEHTDEVLLALGHSQEDLIDLKVAGVIT